jgi:hypothetical protein
MHLSMTMLALLVAGAALYAAGPEGVRLKGIPAELQWKNVPKSWEADERGLKIVAGKSTDWFVSPLDGKTSSNAPILLFKPEGDFVLSAKLTVELQKQWDAGCLMVYINDTTWAKFALELSAYMEPTIVTVVTRGVSDDCNSSVIAGNSVYMQIGKTGSAIMFYASAEGSTWKLVRSFTLGAAKDVRVGFASQSPLGETGTALFSEIRYRAGKISDLFKGI